ncbi:uncharacterized protein LOC121738188 isoform X4 [Aricia agestis]|uniref:uncharacterized protein LOC121738188 isoform X4 n=1 Tax=Aricia agestis TaxID=91739 RepID=UPI001C202725|nr:uncharacterized protein LOC121738188 isoform X4 [Aricia agestis]
MMLTLYGLPQSFHYKDVKALIRTQCEIVDFILDNLSVESGFKKIRVGLATESEGNHLIKCLDGFQVQGCMLKVLPILKGQSSSDPVPIENYQENVMQPSYNAAHPNPWSQEPQWQGNGNQTEPIATYPQHYQQNQPYVQPQQSIPIINRQPANTNNRFQMQQNYDKPVTIMKENFQGPHYVQQNQPIQFPPTQQAWTPHMQQNEQFNPAPTKVQYNRQLRECDVQPSPMEAGFKASGTSSHSQFAAPAHRQQMIGRGMSPERENTGRGRTSPGRNLPERRISPSRGMGQRNMSPDRRRENQSRRMSPTGHHSPSGRPVLLSGRYDSPSGLAPSGHNSPQATGRQMPHGVISPSGRQMPQSGRYVSPPRRQMPQGGRQISPPRRQMPQESRHISPSGRHLPQSGRHISPPGRHISPSGRQMPQGSRQISPPGRQMPQGGRQISPPRRQMPQESRHISPPGRHMLQSDRHISPPGRQMSHSGRHISPPGRQMPQGDRHILPPGRQMLQGGRHGSPPGRHIPQSGRHISPSGRQMPQGGRHISPTGRQVLLPAPVSGRQVLPGRLGSPPPRIQISRQVSPPNRHVPNERKSPGRQRQVSPGRRISPTWRRISPSGRQVLIAGRNVSPSGRFSPPGRTVLISEHISPGRRNVQTDRSGRVSPSRQLLTNERRSSPNRVMSGRAISPSGRHISLPGRRVSPSGRRISPTGRRFSPSGRRISPSGRPLHQQSHDTRQHLRYSPPPHKGPIGNYDQADPRSSFKQAIQLYDKASDQGMYSSGFRPNVRDDKPYPRGSRWQEREQFPDRNLGPHNSELNRFSNQQMGKEEKTKSRSLTRESIRDRSPIRAPKRHSPSPRSPRRSWALEKRHSPDLKEAPPPPVWPGQDSHFQRPNPHYQDRKEEPWNKIDKRHRAPPSFDEKDSIRNWKPRAAEPPRFVEGHKNQFVKTFGKDLRDREPNREDGSRNYEAKRLYQGEETQRYHAQTGREVMQKQDYKEVKQDVYADEKTRNPVNQTNPKTAPQDKNLKDYGGKLINKPSDFAKGVMNEKTRKNREKAAAEIATKIIRQFGDHYKGKRRELILKEVIGEILRMMYRIFRNVDVAFLDIIVKFEGKFSTHYRKIFQHAVSKVTNEVKKKKMMTAGQKRPQPTQNPVPAKVVKRDENHSQIKEDTTASAKPSPAPKQQTAAKPQQQDKNQAAKQTLPAQESKPTPTVKVDPKPAAKDTNNAAENKTKVEPARKETPKTEPKRQSGEIKVLSVTQINELSNKNQETQETKPEEKAAEESKKSEDTEGNYFELNELMSNVLKKELRGIMDKVWSCLLVQPDTPEEVMAVDLIRYEGVDRIRDAIGLNVAKRLLNVFNPLFVKIQFSCRPENGCLTAFLKQHNIKSFKRIPQAENTFAAQLQDVAEFDALCYTKDIKCGSADLKITPCYKFTQCPPNLKLNLDDDDDYYVYPTDDECDDEDDEIDTQMFDEFDKETTEKVEEKSEKVDQPKPESQNETKDKIDQSESDSKNEATKSSNKESKDSNISNAKPSNAKTKEIPSKDAVNKNKIQADKEEKNIQKPAGATAKANPINKEANKTNEIITKDKNNAEMKNNMSKDKATEAKKKITSQTQNHKVAFNDVRKKIPKPKPRATKRTFKVIDEDYDDNDGIDDEEMADEDILALLSGGVVLDECGSDD